MSKKKILMQRFNGTGYDPQYPETHVKNVTGVNQTVANNVGVATTDGATVIGEMSEIDYFVSPQGTTTGTSTAYNLSIGSQYTSLDDMDGVVVRAKFHTATGDNPTLNVNGLGAKPILAENGANIPYQIGENVWATLIWSSTLNGWVVQGWGKKRVFYTEIFKESTRWVAPDVDGQVNVRIFGGGGGGARGDYYSSTRSQCGGGGGGGYMSVSAVKVEKGRSYSITIGEGGSTASAGGASSFGALLSANGGAPGYEGYGGKGGSGGGGAFSNVYSPGSGTGGEGSYGGGGGGGTYSYSQEPQSIDAVRDYSGGNGGVYGGGGGGGYINDATNKTSNVSNGGKGRNGAISYGAGYRYTDSSSHPCVNGGGGGGYSRRGNNATSSHGGTGGAGENTIGRDLEFTGSGEGGKLPISYYSAGAGGGGFGGVGGNCTSGCGGGGGGYGASGGNGGIYGGGGGGGYGGNGGNGQFGAGGGGGYGVSGIGGDGGSSGDDKGDGKPGGIAAGGGGGFGNVTVSNPFSTSGGNGGSGICIITYWAWE